MIFGSGFEVTLPAFKGFAWNGNQYIWPILFVTVGCGAVSGFHSMVGSGTSSKQLRNEKDSLAVGYGGMLLEGLVAVIALGAVMIGVRDEVLQDNPVAVYAKGFGLFSEFVGLNPRIGASLGALAITSFVLTTLDTATRLTRYQIQELSGGRVGKFAATGIAVAGAFAFLLIESDGRPTFNLIWPVFGAANQLVAVLALLIIAVWLRKAMGKRAAFLMLPMWFLLFTTVAALVMLIRDQFTGAHMAPDYVIAAVCALIMVLAAFMLREAWKAMRPGRD